MVNEVLKCKNDGIALIDKVVEVSDDLLDNKDDMVQVANFFKTQKNLFDNATEFNKNIQSSVSYFSGYPDVIKAINKIKDIITYKDHYDYNQIKELNGLMSEVNTVKADLVEQKKNEAKDVIAQCTTAIKAKANTDLSKLSQLLQQATTLLETREEEVDALDDLVSLDAKISQIWNDKDDAINEMEKALKPVVPKPAPPVTKKVKKSYRNVLLQQKRLSSKEDIDNYVEELRKKLNSLLSDCDEIDIQ